MKKFKEAKGKVIRKADGGVPDPQKDLKGWLASKQAEQGLIDESGQFLNLGSLLGRMVPGLSRAAATRATLPSAGPAVKFATDAGSRALPAAASRGAIESGAKLLTAPGGKALTRTGASLVKPTAKDLVRTGAEIVKSGAKAPVAKAATEAAAKGGGKSARNLIGSIGAGIGALGMGVRTEDSDEDTMRNLLAYTLAGSQEGKSRIPNVPLPGMPVESDEAAVSSGSPVGSGKGGIRKAPMPQKRASVPTYLDRDMDFMSKMTQADPELMKTIAKGLPSLPGSAPKGEGEGEDSELASMMAASGKGKSGFKKFMKDYGKFIALGAMAGAGGKAGRIAAPIMAALPGLIEMMKSKKKSSGGEPLKKSEGGAIRKFKGGSMKGNSMDSMLTPKYAKGGKTDKMGKAAGEMPQHKKMAMGKPTPQSTGQKFAKGGAAKYAGGGMCKGYGISKKIRPTGPMN